MSKFDALKKSGLTATAVASRAGRAGGKSKRSIYLEVFNEFYWNSEKGEPNPRKDVIAMMAHRAGDKTINYASQQYQFLLAELRKELNGDVSDKKNVASVVHDEPLFGDDETAV